MKLSEYIVVWITAIPTASLAVQHKVRYGHSPGTVIGNDFPSHARHTPRGSTSNVRGRHLLNPLKMGYLNNPSGSSNTMSPTQAPTLFPTTHTTTFDLNENENPSSEPSTIPSISPTTSEPSIAPSTEKPSAVQSLPSQVPSDIPSVVPSPGTALPSTNPSLGPSGLPTLLPSQQPSVDPSFEPSTSPSVTVTEVPSQHPTQSPSAAPSQTISLEPSSLPSSWPTAVEEEENNPTTRACEALFSGSLFEGINEQLVDVDQGGFGNLGDVYIWDNNVISSEVVHGISGFSAGRCILLEDETASVAEDNFYCSVSFYLGDDGGFVLQGVFYEPLIGGGVDCFEGMVGLVDYRFVGQEFAYDVSLVHDDTATPADCPPDLLTNQWIESVNNAFYDWDLDSAPSPGDSFIYNSSAIDTGTSRNGTVHGECMYLEETNSTEKIFCTSTFRMIESGDQLVVMGILKKLTIIAGSGCFLGISGTVQGTDTSQSRYNIQVDQPNSSQDQNCIADIFTNPWREEIGDVYVDYLQNGVEDAGEVYVLNNKVLTIPLVDGTVETGLLSGRCFVSTAGEQLFCQYAIEAPGGTIVTQGLFSNMLIVGASGCFQGLNGYLEGGTNPSTLQFIYRWVLIEEATS